MNDVHAIDEKTLAAYLSEQIDSSARNTRLDR